MEKAVGMAYTPRGGLGQESQRLRRDHGPARGLVSRRIINICTADQGSLLHAGQVQQKGRTREPSPSV
ncbi:MAG TPA: hypothetical protein VGX03_11975 [Candidatus Binatia bacterium]|nr:hypothetical protein [Candidatus Binatia bacterium]